MSLNTFNQIALMSCLMLNKPPEQQLHAYVVHLCPHGSCVFPEWQRQQCSYWNNKSFNGMKRMTTMAPCNNLITSQRSFCGKRKRWSSIFRHYQWTKTITPNLILVIGSNVTGYTYCPGELFFLPSVIQIIQFRLGHINMVTWLNIRTSDNT